MKEQQKGELPTEKWSSFGQHEHRFEPPDVYVSRVRGDVSAQDMMTQIYTVGNLAKREGHAIFWLADVRKIGILGSEARRAAAAASSTELRAALAGSAVVGAAFSTRVVMTLLVRAVRLLNPTKNRPIAFVETEAQARAFLDEQRRVKNAHST